ncbi:pseudouridine synthase [Portibacter marinus]|uniref:pseudouridine synthase n=1 Tax=Portibacter marinus TaxID=2898660 RepID=UPI001F2A9BF7|nr:pseudouridine synthase [Portibacter marinus]
MADKKHRHFKLHKPYGYLSQFVRYERNRRNKKMLGALYDFPEGTMSVGRLDEKSEGLLILTTDGQVSFDLRSKNVEKEYYVQVDGEITQEAIEGMKKGVVIGFDGKKYQTLPCQIWRINDPDFIPRKKKIRDARHGPTSWISVVLTEGKYKQVRKMTSAVGFPTLRLVRVRIGNIHLGVFEPGRVEEISF